MPAGLKHLLVERFKAHLSVDGGPPTTIRARTVLIGNCGKLTGGINLMPDAEPDDGTLDVVVIAPKGLTAWVAVAARVLTKSERTTQTLDRYRCQSVGIRVDHDQKIELDGDIIGEATHIEVEVQPRALIVRTETGRSVSLTAQNLRSRHCRSNGSRQVYGAMSWWIWFGPQVPCA